MKKYFCIYGGSGVTDKLGKKQIKYFDFWCLDLCKLTFPFLPPPITIAACSNASCMHPFLLFFYFLFFEKQRKCGEKKYTKTLWQVLLQEATMPQ